MSDSAARDGTFDYSPIHQAQQQPKHGKSHPEREGRLPGVTWRDHMISQRSVISKSLSSAASDLVHEPPQEPAG